MFNFLKNAITAPKGSTEDVDEDEKGEGVKPIHYVLVKGEVLAADHNRSRLDRAFRLYLKYKYTLTSESQISIVTSGKGSTRRDQYRTHNLVTAMSRSVGEIRTLKSGIYADLISETEALKSKHDARLEAFIALTAAGFALGDVVQVTVKYINDSATSPVDHSYLLRYEYVLFCIEDSNKGVGLLHREDGHTNGTYITIPFSKLSEYVSKVS